MQSFADHFWGEKNNGFDVLYHNMKNGLQSSKELESFIRECCTIDETYAKLLVKLANHANNYSNLGSFAPFWQVLKTLAEKLSTLHMELVKSWQALMKEVTEYTATQVKIHKAVKDSESGTLETVQAIQQTTTALYKARETYHARCLEYERLKRENGSQKDLEKSETKYKRAMEEYKSYVEKYSTIRDEFEQKMTDTSKNFQNVEEKHLEQLITFVDKYAETWQEGHNNIGQAYENFRSDYKQFTVDKLIQLFLESKATGPEKPGPVEFEDADLSSLPAAAVPSPDPSLEGPKDDVSLDSSEKEKKDKKKREDSTDSLPSPSFVRTFTIVSGIFGGRKKDKKKKKKKNNDGGSVDDVSRDSKDTDSIDTFDKELNTPEVDEEGFSIKPSIHNPDHKDATWGFSSGEDSDDDRKKFKVEIKPISEKDTITTGTVEDIRNSVGSLRLSPTMARRRNVSRTDVMKSEKPAFSSSSSQNDLLNIDFFAGRASGDTFTSENNSTWNTSSGKRTPDIFANNNLEPPPIPPKSNHNTDAAFIPGPPGIAPRTSQRKSLGNQATARPNGRQSPALPGMSHADTRNMSRAESGSSISNFRGPSPLTIGMSDTIPVAVAFTETINAYFKGSDDTKCIAKISGNLMISFPAGIVKVLTDNPSPPTLSFRIKNTHQLELMHANKQLVTQDTNQPVNNSSLFAFNMTALSDHLRHQQEINKSASYFNIDILKYTVKCSSGTSNTPLKVVTYWKCEPHTTDLRLDYSYNPGAMPKSLPLSNVMFLVPFNGQVLDVQSVPEATWSAETKRTVWKLREISPLSEDKGVSCLRAKFQVSEQTMPSTVAVQFTCEGTTLSGVDFELAGPGYRLSLGKKRFATGKYFADTDNDIRYV